MVIAISPDQEAVVALPGSAGAQRPVNRNMRKISRIFIPEDLLAWIDS